MKSRKRPFSNTMTASDHCPCILRSRSQICSFPSYFNSNPLLFIELPSSSKSKHNNPWAPISHSHSPAQFLFNLLSTSALKDLIDSCPKATTYRRNPLPRRKICICWFIINRLCANFDGTLTYHATGWWIQALVSQADSPGRQLQAGHLEVFWRTEFVRPCTEAE